ncbi:HAMP domain-containing histidine kinase [Aestuariibacter sp. GS-14]|uniref:HAMP domain-containing histidine kinase n=1 Tax=Aestuariibacter sp. GS-14 TaxID=2590670 RepID=UPI00112CF7B5|nr:HAMP domain-containing histidine kinase [Aestuariibacter sp. GS-14]TPV60820.1 HAMP domain-containing histidine kinase [Aestuariibacter sp. GS-14]
MLLLLYLALFGKQRAPSGLVITLVLFEIIVVNTSIALNGAASNPFASVLLVPLILGLVWLPVLPGLVVLAISVVAQAMQLMAPISDHHGAMMQSHAQGMIGSFIVTSCMIAAVVHFFKYQLKVKQAAIQQLRERQLRDEQLLAIGTAAAQLTHDAATPVQSMQLLLEELQDSPGSPDLSELQMQFDILQALLSNWRDVANEVRAAKVSDFSVQSILNSARHIVRLSRPETEVNWPSPENAYEQVYITADRTLVPAIASIIINACDAANLHHNNTVNIQSDLQGESWQLSIDNPSDNDNPLHSNLGAKIVSSENGSGVGAVLSNATVEKFRGTVHWQYEQARVHTTITLPVTT